MFVRFSALVDAGMEGTGGELGKCFIFESAQHLASTTIVVAVAAVIVTVDGVGVGVGVVFHKQEREFVGKCFKFQRLAEVIVLQ